MNAKIRSSRPELFYKKDILNNFAKFTEKNMCHSLAFNIFAGPGSCIFAKKDTLVQVLSWECCEIFRNTFS